MGCCQGPRISTEQERDFCLKIKESIDDNSVKRLDILLSVLMKTAKKNEPLFIDKVIAVEDDISFNALGYSAYKGNDKIFKYLFENGASLRSMEELFLSQKLKLINVLCSKGHIDVLKFYLPLYLRHYRSSVSSMRSSTLDLYDELPNQVLPIHAACETGMCNIVLFLYNFFKSYSVVPRDFSIYTLDEARGEDASLIACRSGSYFLVKMLYDLGMNFKRLNKHQESAIMVCVQGDRINPNYSYLEILTHLVEVSGLDVTYRFEEVLMMASSDLIIDYLEDQLVKKGIFFRKDRGKSNNEFDKFCGYKEYEKNEDELFEKPFHLDSFVSSIGKDKETPMSLSGVFYK